MLKAGSHPDNYILEPEEADKAIKVDQVRDLVSFVVQTAQLGGRKVVLIEPVESMNINAANALLKSLEEPSGDTVLLLVSHQPSRLLPTIKSRCVQQACPLPSEAMSLAWLAKALPDCSQEERIELLTLAAGSPLAAVNLQAQGVREQRAQVVDGVKKLLKQQQSPTQLAEGWNAIPLLLLFDWFCDWSSLILRYQLTQDEEGLGLPDMRKVDSIPGAEDRAGQSPEYPGLDPCPAPESTEQGQPQPGAAAGGAAGAVGVPACPEVTWTLPVSGKALPGHPGATMVKTLPAVESKSIWPESSSRPSPSPTM